MAEPTPLREVLPAAVDIPGQLRRLADRIEAGELLDVRAVGVCVLNTNEVDRLHTYGYGRDAEPGWLALMFGLAIQRFQRGIDRT